MEIFGFGYEIMDMEITGNGYEIMDMEKIYKYFGYKIMDMDMEIIYNDFGYIGDNWKMGIWGLIPKFIIN